MNPEIPKDTPLPEDTPIPKLNRFEKTMYGIGSGGYQLAADGVKQLANPIYNITLGLSPTLIGMVLMISRLFDAFTDPLMGKISDDTRTRFGRRRPYIFVGAFLSATAFILIWRVNPNWGQNGILGYYLGAMLFFYLCSTIQVVPYHTLGLEMTSDYNERTTIAGYKMCFSFIFLLMIPWVFRLAQAEAFEGTLSGMRYLSYILAGAIVLGGIIPAIFVKERYYRLASKQRKLPFWSSAKMTFQNRSFVLLTLIIVFSGACVGMVSSLGPYIVFYYMYGGDLKAGAEMAAIIANVSAILSLISIPAVAWLANRWGKIKTLKLLMVIGMIGMAMKFVLYNQEFPWLAPFVAIFLAPNAAGFWTLVTSMKADICDEDELKHGLRREGMFGSIGNWVVKLAVSLSFLIAGVILDLTGFDIALGSNQSPDTLLLMRILFSVVPLVFIGIAIFLVSRFPLTKERMAEIRTELEARRQAV